MMIMTESSHCGWSKSFYSNDNVHRLCRYLRLSDRLSSAAYRNPGWYIRFRKAQRAFMEAQCETRAFEVGNLESYVSFRRQQSGFLISLEMIAYAKDLRLPENLLSSEKLEILRDCACDIAALSEVRTYRWHFRSLAAEVDGNCTVN